MTGIVRFGLVALAVLVTCQGANAQNGGGLYDDTAVTIIVSPVL